MQAIWIRKHGGPEVLEIRESPDPTPGADEIRIRTRAAGLNFAEVSARQGIYPDAPKPPCVVGYEGSGVVDAVGSAVTKFRPGDSVVFMRKFGAHASAVCVKEHQAFVMPPGMTYEEGAALPVNYLTAYHMLYLVRRVRPGDTVLVHMAAGGVGTAVLQLCRAIGGVTTIGTASAGKHEYVKSHGCDHAVDYRSTDYVAAVRAITNGRGVDVVLDALGGPDWKKGYELLAPGGLLVAFGLANAAVAGKRNLLHAMTQILKSPLYHCMKLMDENRGVAGVNMGHLWDEVDLLRGETEALVALYQQGKIRPHIGGIYKFSQARDAHGEIEHGKNVGKIVLVPD